MKFEPNVLVHVFLKLKDEKRSVGRLALKDRRLFFEYTPEHIESGLELSPFKLPLKSGVQQSEDFVFDGLFGLFNDSLPDGWGRLLLDRKLRQMGIVPNHLSTLDRLSYVGSQGMGALTYEPEIKGPELKAYKELDIIAEEIKIVINDGEDCFVDDLLALNGSSAGARPKIVTKIDGEDWIIKFRASIDPEDIGPIEFAYHQMAKQAGLIVPEAKLFPSKKSSGYFGVKRFDRKEGQRFHMHTLSGLLHVDHRLPSVEYETILKATAWLTKDIRETEKQFRACVFNVFAHNRDDHAKNFSFLMDEKGGWHTSPSYDLTFSSGPVGEHCSLIMGEGKAPSERHLFKLAGSVGLKKESAQFIIQEVKDAVANWKMIAKDSGVSSNSAKLIQKYIL